MVMEATPAKMNGKGNSKRNNDPWTPLTPDTKDDLHSPLNPAPQNPLYQMIDSERYIQSLEKKLEKLTKARKQEPTSREIISSLMVFHDDQMKRYVDDSQVLEMNSNSFGEEFVQTSYVQRKLHPERQPLNAEELVELVKEDVMANTSEDAENTGTELNSKSPSVNTSLSKFPTTKPGDEKVVEGASNDKEQKPDTSQNEQVAENWANFEEMDQESLSVGSDHS